jgi:ribosome-associated protein
VEVDLSKNPAVALCELALEKKALDPVILDVEELISYCSHFLLVSGTNGRQVRAIAQHLQAHGKKELGLKTLSIEGMQNGRWVLIDFGDVVVHVFDKDMRGFYDLDGLWADAPRVEVPESQLAV